MSDFSPLPEPLLRYLSGEPLNPELAALRDGKMDEQISPAASPIQPPAMDPDRDLNKEERLALYEIRTLPGWAVLDRLLEKTCRIHQSKAIILANGDPLRDRDAIAEAFAYAQMYRRAKMELLALADAELKELALEQSRGTGE
jgi:hypothetical protein